MPKRSWPNGIYFLILWVLTFGIQAYSANSCLQSLQKNLVQSGLSLPAQKLYVEGDARSNHMLFFTGAEYSKALEVDAIPLDSILVLDEIPLVEDLPLVAGIIISSDLKQEATHVQILAEKMQIPLVFSQGAFQNPELKNLVNANRSFKLSCKAGQCHISGESTEWTPRARMESVLPRYADRTQRQIFTLNDPLAFAPREVSGDKFYSLMEFKKNFPSWVPDISSLSSGYYEYFLDNYESRGKLLRVRQSQLLRDLKEAQSNHDEEKIKVALSEFGDDILKATPYWAHKNVFAQILTELHDYYGKLLGLYSLRSNNDVEDLLAAGLYKSLVVHGLSKKAVEEGVRKIWASMFEYRAFAIRRYWGQREANLSMPIMVHPYVGNVLSHAVAVFRFNQKHGLSLEVNMVMGENEKATNPSPEAQTAKFIVRQNRKGKGQLVPNSNGTQINKKMEKAVLDFFNVTQQYVMSDFLSRTYTPTLVNIEFVIQKPRFWWASPKVKVLQYKPGFNREIVLSILSGMLTREETDQRVNTRNQMKDTSDVIGKSTARKLETTVPESVLAFYEKRAPRHKKPLRYVLVMEEGVPYFLVWDSGIFHIDMKAKLSNSKIKWFKSGYITFKTPFEKPTLVFTETTIHEGTDRPLLLADSQALFEQAFANSVSRNAELQKILRAIDPEIIFHTFEGNGRIRWTPDFLSTEK